MLLSGDNIGFLGWSGVCYYTAIWFGMFTLLLSCLYELDNALVALFILSRCEIELD